MALIKSSKIPDTVVRFSLPDVEEQARVRLARAQSEAEAIIAQATVRAAQIESAAREQGQADGYQQGHTDGRDSGAIEALDQHRERLCGLIATFESAAAALEKYRAQVEAAATRDAVELALAIAGRITRRIGVIDPAALLENVRAALNIVGRAGVTRVAVHPSQRALLAGILPQLQLDSPGLRTAEIVDDDSIAPGGCRVFTSHGHVDADLKTQLDRVTQKLLPGSNGSNGGGGA
ncbi:MAG: flagellar assembly protein FliH [Humisphaera sp.]|nr:flagellar assembly protein FliH [Humisphaera sp.]